MILVAAATAVLFLALPGFPAVGAVVVTAGAVGLSVAALVACLGGQFTTALVLVAFLAPLQPAMRLLAPNLPYLLLEYWLPLLALFVVVQSPGGRSWSKSTLFLGAFVFIELVDVARADSWMLARSVLLPSAGLLAMLVIGDRLRLRPSQAQAVFAAFLAGAAGLTAIVARGYFTGQVTAWTQNSNFEASAGMGPNQVSLLFAVASFLALVLADRAQPAVKIALRVTVCVLSLLMILTFSRGGLFILAGAVLAYYLLFRKPSAKRVGAVVAFVLLIALTLQISSRMTDGAIVQRYSERTTSNRLDLFMQAWNIFRDNPMVGLGTGRFFQAVSGGDRFGIASGAHNELGRAAAEHGIVGLVTWTAFAFFSLVVAWTRARDEERALRVTLVCMAFTIMFYNGLKLVAPALLLFLSMVRWGDDTPVHSGRRMPRAFPARLNMGARRVTR